MIPPKDVPQLPTMADWITPYWQPHPRVRACVTTRFGTLSPPPWQGFNLGLNCGDEAERVEQARRHVQRLLGTPHPPTWLRQVHGTRIVTAGDQEAEADGVWTDQSGFPCAVLTADCLPVLLARTDGSAVAAVHAGWRGLQQGIIEEAVARIAPGGEPVSAWLGPAISQPCYQVGQDVYEAFTGGDPEAAAGFRADAQPHHWRLSLVQLAWQRLNRMGVTDVLGGEHCTASDPTRFYSFRYEGQTGRFASLIWLDPAT